MGSKTSGRQKSWGNRLRTAWEGEKSEVREIVRLVWKGAGTAEAELAGGLRSSVWRSLAGVSLFQARESTGFCAWPGHSCRFQLLALRVHDVRPGAPHSLQFNLSDDSRPVPATRSSGSRAEPGSHPDVLRIAATAPRMTPSIETDGRRA